MSFNFSHDSISKLACKWLLRNFSQNGAGCKVALTELGGVTRGEIADAWGYRWGWRSGSVLVEVKTSRTDFLADMNKPHRNGEALGMGNYRYYMCPKGLISAEELPDGWGLLWVNKRGHISPQYGHVVCDNQYADNSHLDRFHHKANVIKELEVTSHLLSRLSDPQKANEMIRGANLERNRLAKQLERVNKELRSNQRYRTAFTNLIFELENTSSLSDEAKLIIDNAKQFIRFSSK